MAKHFCTCPMLACKRHPLNRDKGCDPCMEANLKSGKIPACFFAAVKKDLSGVKDYTFNGFAEFYRKTSEEASESPELQRDTQ